MTQRDSNLVEVTAREIEKLLARSDKSWLWLNSYSRALFIAQIVCSAVLEAVIVEADIEQNRRAVDHIEMFAAAHSIPLTTPEKGGE